MTLALFPMLALPLLLACPDPPPEIAGAAQDVPAQEAQRPNRGGPEGDPSAMDLSPGGTLLLDISQVTPQKTQEELKSSGQNLIQLSGSLSGSCDGGSIRIDVIEVGVEHSDSGPMIGPVTALFPSGPGDYSLVTPSGKSYQVSALCDIDKDGKIVQDTDKLAPGIALGEVTEDRSDINLIFPGDGDTPVEVGDQDGGQVQPPGDNTASLPSAEAGARDRSETASTEPVPPPPESDENQAAPNLEDADAPSAE